ncbi:MAG: OmpA family protein [Kiritimatiellae bacterium]|nr:OmpA family protein [Kiritimatiellia bacterium]
MTKRAIFAAGLALAMAAGGASGADDLFARAPWFATLGGGYLHLEGDVEAEPGFGAWGALGYSLNSWWDVEGSVHYFPALGARDAKDLNINVVPLEDDTTALRLGADVLLHLRATENRRIDPFVKAGAAVTFFGDELENGKTQGGVYGGLGMFYHFDDNWALRIDASAGAQGDGFEFTGLVDAGVSYRFGGTKKLPPAYSLNAGPGDIDSDGDGLMDRDEALIGTDPFDPDTDKDGLGDGDEYFRWKTDPLNPDSDFDGLLDGAEVLTYKTDPLDPDTDKGGVSDGHEVIEDGTNPLDPADDLQKFTLLIEFDYDKDFIRPQYYKDFAPVLKVLERDPNATVRVEGHADKRPTSKRAYNQKLSERRARAVADYLIRESGIAPERVTAVGFGFDKPVAPNDTEENMQKNRRTDIYIRKGN